MTPDSPLWMQYATLLMPVIVSLFVVGINLFASSRVAAERDRNQAERMEALRSEMSSGQAETKAALGRFGERIGTVQEEMIRLQTGLGMGGEHGLFSEMRDTRRVVEELRAAHVTAASAIAARVGVIESQVHGLMQRAGE